MCECSKVHLYEVEFKLDGMTVVPTHKNCGFALDEKQADKFQKELVKSWGFEEEEGEFYKNQKYFEQRARSYPYSEDCR